MESIYLIQYKYDSGVYSLEMMCELVDKNWITEKDFHNITGYDYKTIKNGSDF